MLWNTNFNLDKLKESPSNAYHQKGALYFYNFLRELNLQPPATTIKEIDQAWLDAEGYRIWKDELKTSMKNVGIITTDQQVSSVFASMPWYLYQLKSSSNDEILQKETLYRYNFLKELKGLPPVKTVQEIDPSWFYELWKDQEKERWKNAQITTLLGQVIVLIRTFDTSVNDRVKEQSEFMRDVSQETALYAYNFLRELLHRNTAQTFTAIDRQWVDQVRDEASPYLVMEQQKTYKAPTSLQVYLVKKAKDLLKIRDELTTFSYEGLGAAGILGPEKHYIALCDIPDIDQQIAIIYHELGHIVHKDADNYAAILRNERTYTDFVQDPSFQSDINKIDHYQELGRKAFDKSTPIGQHIAGIFLQNPTLKLWAPPDNAEELQKMLYLRGIEKRADLFEMEQLFEQQLLGVLLSHIALYAFGWTSVPLTAEAYHDHPSDLERALYMAGFLVDKGLDINKAFSEWYATGKCKALPMDLSDILFSMPPKIKTIGARDLISAYESHKKADQKNALLFLYNLLRELKGLQPADSLKDTDRQGLDEIKMEVKKEADVST